MIETIMERIAKATGKDPIDVRIANMNPDDKKALEPMIAELKKTSEYDKRLKDIKKFNNVSYRIGIINFQFKLSKYFIFTGQSMEKTRNILSSHEISAYSLRSVSCFSFNLCTRWHSFSVHCWYRNGSRSSH